METLLVLGSDPVISLAALVWLARLVGVLTTGYACMPLFLV